jgi:molybdopterin-synthase adenylyltransferase
MSSASHADREHFVTARQRLSPVYERQLPLQGWGEEGQERLSEATVFAAGLGGLGCPAAVYLTLAGVGRLVVCDADDVEQSNLNRQFLYGPADIGRRKAAVGAERLRALNPLIDVVPSEAEIDQKNVLELIEGADLVLDCLDNLETRIILSRACMERRTPLVHGATAELTGYVSFFNPPETPCLECFQTAKPASVEPAIPGFSAGIVGSLQAMEAVKYLLGIGDLLAGRVLVFEGAVPSMDVIAFDRDPGCPACGDRTR